MRVNGEWGGGVESLPRVKIKSFFFSPKITLRKNRRQSFKLMYWRYPAIEGVFVRKREREKIKLRESKLVVVADNKTSAHSIDKMPNYYWLFQHRRL